jgi:hypothetical protein
VLVHGGVSISVGNYQADSAGLVPTPYTTIASKARHQTISAPDGRSSSTDSERAGQLRHHVRRRHLLGQEQKQRQQYANDGLPVMMPLL